MADGPFYTACGRVEFFGDVGIKDFCDAAEEFNIVIHHGNGFTQIKIAFDMGRHTDLMDNACNAGIEIFPLRLRLAADNAALRRRRTVCDTADISAYLADMADKVFHIKRLQDEIGRA